MTGDRSDRPHPSRRTVLCRGAVLVTFGAVVATATAASAAAKTPKTAVKYQYTPKGKAQCGLCASFIAPSGGGTGAGTCQVVDGPIPQDGWCLLYSPKG
jgi:hypothetical protein